MSRSQQHTAWLILAMLALIWGSSFILIKKGLQAFSAGQVGSLRIAIAFVLLLPFALRGMRQVPARSWKYIAISGIVGNLIPAYLFATAQTSLDSSVAGILNALTPIFTLLISVVYFRQVLKRMQVGGLIMGFLGSVSLSFVQAGGQLGSLNYYVFYILLATVCYGISVNTIKAYLGQVPSLLISSCAVLLVGPVALVHLLSGDFAERLLNPGGYMAFFYIFLLGALGTALGLIFFNKLVKMTSPVVASSVTYLIPIVALVWGMVDGESLTILHLLGMLLIITGVYLVNKGR